MFDDRPVEIAELTYVIKQDLSSLNAQISSLQSLSKSQKSQSTRSAAAEQEGEHNKNVRSHTQMPRIRSHRLTDLPGCRPPPRQTRRRRCQFQRSTRSPNEKHPSLAITYRELRVISIVPFPTLPRSGPIRLPALQHPHQITDSSTRLSKPKLRYPEFRPVFLLIIFRLNPRAPTVRSATLDDGRSTTHKYIYKHAWRSHRRDRKNHQRARQRIRSTCSHGLRARVRDHPPLSLPPSHKSQGNNIITSSLQNREMVQRIDANTEDVVDNVEGAQRELMKYWSRVSGNRWLVAKMFGVLMVRQNLHPFLSPPSTLSPKPNNQLTLSTSKKTDILPPLGPNSRINKRTI